MSMHKFILFLLLAISGTHTLAQQQFFIYIQSTASQPFYTRIQNRIYSSSENGYLIVPKLHDSTYDVFVGFARNAAPEQHFTVDMNRQDQGFELRNFGDKGWGLFNIQSTAVVMNSTPVQKVVADNTGEKKNDAFSQMLANVVNDSAILYTAVKPVAAPPPPQKKPAATDPAAQDTTALASTTPVTTPAATGNKPPVADSSQPASKADTSVQVVTRKEVKTDTAAAVTPVEKPVATTTPPPVKPKADSTAGKTRDLTEKPFIVRISESKNEEGYKASFIEQYNFSTDTINISIPLKETLPVAPPATQTRATTPQATTQKPTDTPAVSTVQPAPVAKKADTVAVQKKQDLVVTNSDCKNFASDNDVDKLRVKMLAENAVDDKLIAAKKAFKTKCFSVKQIKALTELFPSDETRYRFFDTAYPFVSDTENFGSLDEMISNDYYKTRFKAMIRR